MLCYSNGTDNNVPLYTNPDITSHFLNLWTFLNVIW